MIASEQYLGAPASIAQARAFIERTLSEASADLRDRAVLITSELATNAIVHARSAFTLTATTSAEEVHIAVRNEGETVPVLQAPEQGEPHGRGLLIANALADRWGIDTGRGSTTVWFALSCR